MRKVSEWIKSLNNSQEFLERFKEIYGEESELIRDYLQWYSEVLRDFGRVYGLEREVILVRAPARVNLLGMHVDHRGGCINPIATKEILMVAEKREDDKIILHNTDSENFSPREFKIGEELPEEEIEDWEAWTSHLKENIKADWINYVKSIILYLQNIYREKKFWGMNLMVSGNIPRAAGLSSSSAMVVASAEAIINLNNLEVTPQEMIDMCGMAEWYVGTRGGKGDHAAIKLSRRGFLSHICFFPLKIEFIPFPRDYRVVICNSLKEAKKSEGAREIFNERVATYEIGFLLIKKRYRQFSEKIKYLRDVNKDNLKVGEEEIYKIVESLPERISREEIEKEVPYKHLEKIYQTHKESEEGYRVREVCLFGLAECERSKIGAERLKEGDVEGFGELMNISHEGDRVGPKISAGSSEVPLYRQPGGYRVSCEELDELVDIARTVPGVVGARLTGAGLGGCMATLVKKENVTDLKRAVEENYYKAHKLPPAVEVCFPVEGAGVIS